MDLSEKSRTGNKEVKWLRPTREAIAKKAVKILSKKRNWSAPCPDKHVNYWWKRAQVLHVGVAKAFVSMERLDLYQSLWNS